MTAAMVDDASGIRRTRLDSGLRVVTEHLPGLRSAAVGFWVGTGSRDEPEAIAGTSHFLEHLLFKGTETRHAAEIAEAVESCGGDMNAFTGQEVTAYYVRVPDRFLGLALEILSDIVWSPALRTDEVESERQVILEEIRMRDDTPDDLVHDVFSGALFARHPLGREIAGSQDSIGAVTRDQIAAYHADHYQPSNVVVAVAGNVEHDEVVRRVVDAQPTDGRARPARAGGADTADADRFARVDRPLEQSHVVLGARALRRDDPDRFALAVVDQVLGGGMSSRLFQEVREKRGLAYSVFSYRSAFEETGALAVYCATAPERVDETLDVVRGELDRLVADGGVTESPPRAISPGRWRCRWRARRVACTASGAASSRWARSRASTGWSSRSTRSPRRTSPGSSTGCSARARARWRSSAPPTRSSRSEPPSHTPAAPIR
jgi:predicted Zn-dependent peptidase